jgi:flagellar basal body rod protein FlgG
MSIASILNISKNAMLAQQAALQVASNNMANVNTNGYSKREAVFNEMSLHRFRAVRSATVYAWRV